MVLVIFGYALFVLALRHESLLSQSSSSLFSFLNLYSPTQEGPLTVLEQSEDGSQIIPTTQKWQVSATTDQGQPSEDEYQRILVASEKFLRTAHRDELDFIAQYLMQESVFDRVIIRRVKPQTIHVQLSAPSAVAVIEADTLRYISTSGNIFGQTTQAHQPDLTFVTGVFAGSDSSFVLSPSNKLLVSDDISQKIQLILKALSLGKSAGLSIASIDHNTYRGLKLILADSIQVTLGHPPFEKNIRRLKSLLNQAKDSQKMIKKIELDYKGKAFVQTSS